MVCVCSVVWCVMCGGCVCVVGVVGVVWWVRVMGGG